MVPASRPSLFLCGRHSISHWLAFCARTQFPSRPLRPVSQASQIPDDRQSYVSQGESPAEESACRVYRRNTGVTRRMGAPSIESAGYSAVSCLPASTDLGDTSEIANRENAIIDQDGSGREKD